MSSHYQFICSGCSWQGERYRNLKKCPECGHPVMRVVPPVIEFTPIPQWQQDIADMKALLKEIEYLLRTRR